MNGTDSSETKTLLSKNIIKTTFTLAIIFSLCRISALMLLLKIMFFYMTKSQGVSAICDVFSSSRFRESRFNIHITVKLFYLTQFLYRYPLNHYRLPLFMYLQSQISTITIISVCLCNDIIHPIHIIHYSKPIRFYILIHKL